MTTQAKPYSSLENDQFDRLETLLKNLPGMAYRCLNRAHWPMEFVSDGCFQLCGYHRHEIESQSVLWGDFTHPEMIDEVDRKVRVAVDENRPFELEYKIIARDGQHKWVWERGRVVDFDNDSIAILEGFITDITDRKAAETAMIEAESYARAIVHSAVEAVITLDDDGIILSFNRAASHMFGYPSDKIIGSHCRDLISTSFYRNFDSYFQDTREAQSPTNRGCEFSANNFQNQAFPVHLSVEEIQAGDEVRFVMLIRNLTEQRLAEKEIRKQRDLIAHVDRLNTLGEMAAGIAHEINQPLTAISMYAQTGLRYLARLEPAHDKLEKVLDKLSQQAHRAGAVIERMQEMTKPRESRQEKYNVEKLLIEVHQLAEVEAQIRNFIIVLRLEKNLPDVTCDPIQIQQVILNLLRNGMESMGVKGCPAGSKIVLDASKFNTQLKVSIIDDGMGISSKMEKQLYQPFTSTKPSGMGLGLSISRSIIAAHGGQLNFSNNHAGGASFHFELVAAHDQ
jgi:two-component system, LuxR family, sensor kinase FixL